MADTVTVNYNWTKPEVGSSNDSWGTKLNTSLDGIDATVKAVSNVANAASATASAALPAASYTAADIRTKLLTVDGSGSGIDADLLDGNEASAFLLASAYTASDVRTKLLTVDGAGSGVDADLLDGQEGSYYANIAARLGYTPANKAGDTFTGAVTFSAATTFSAAISGTTANFSGDITSSSDRRLKTEIAEIDGAAAIAALSQVGGKSYLIHDRPSLGVIAQDVSAVPLLTSLVREGSDGMLQVNYLGLIAPLIAAVAHLSEEVVRLKGAK